MKKKPSASGRSRPGRRRLARAAAATPRDQPRLARVARGRRPQYFSDPAIDKLLSITLSLVAELSVTRDRLDTLERMLASRKVLRLADLEAYVPPDDVEAAREQRRRAYLARVLRAVEAELTETTDPAMPKSADEIVAAVSR